MCRELDGLPGGENWFDAGPDWHERTIELGLPDGGVATWSRGYLSSVAGIRCDPIEADLLCTYAPYCVGGRAPEGLEPPCLGTASPVGEWLAASAHLERASVLAFEELAAELRAYGAPSRLTRAALRAADDERRHAEDVARLAALHGADVPAVVRRPSAVRSLAQLTIENAVEGCVREAYGTLLAAHQAEHALDPDVQRTYRAIAQDEARHALLSRELHAWASTRLSEREQEHVRAAHHDAVMAFRAELAQEPDSSVQAVLGLPSAAWSLAACAALVA